MFILIIKMHIWQTDRFLLSKKILYKTKRRAIEVTMMRKAKNPMTALSLSEKEMQNRFSTIIIFVAFLFYSTTNYFPLFKEERISLTASGLGNWNSGTIAISIPGCNLNVINKYCETQSKKTIMTLRLLQNIPQFYRLCGSRDL